MENYGFSCWTACIKYFGIQLFVECNINRRLCWSRIVKCLRPALNKPNCILKYPTFTFPLMWKCPVGQILLITNHSVILFIQHLVVFNDQKCQNMWEMYNQSQPVHGKQLNKIQIRFIWLKWYFLQIRQKKKTALKSYPKLLYIP